MTGAASVQATRVITDTLLSKGPLYLWGWAATYATAGLVAILYEGHDVTNGERILSIRVMANQTNVIWFGKPILFNRGLFVDSSGLFLTLFWEPAPS